MSTRSARQSKPQSTRPIRKRRSQRPVPDAWTNMELGADWERMMALVVRQEVERMYAENQARRCLDRAIALAHGSVLAGPDRIAALNSAAELIGERDPTMEMLSEREFFVVVASNAHDDDVIASVLGPETDVVQEARDMEHLERWRGRVRSMREAALKKLSNEERARLARWTLASESV